MKKHVLQTLLSVIVTCLSFSGMAQIVTTINSTGTWTCPVGVTSVTVECWGGGGGGGGTAAAATYGGGGAGGSYSRSALVVVPGTVYTVTIGAAGSAGSNSGGNGGNGGNTWFNTAATIFAEGGAGGAGGIAGVPGIGGVGADINNIGDIHYRGGSGFVGSTTRSGSGGGSAGDAGMGGDATASGGGLAGISNGVAGADGKTGNGAGNDGNGAPGGSASGGFRASGNARAGGAGNKGRIIITYPGYCTPAAGTVNGTDIITNLSLTNGAGINYSNASSNASPNELNNYVLINNTPYDLYLGTSNTIAITFGTDGTQWSAAWIDFNQNQIFEAGENIALATSSASGGATATYTFNIPSGAMPGNTRLRIRGGSDNAYVANGACANTTYGETEDYIVNIANPPSCLSPTAISISNIGAYGANLAFTPPATTPANGVDYYVSTTSTTPASTVVPTGNGTSNSLTISGLTPATTYYIWLRSNCSSSEQSTWVPGPSFITLCATFSLPYSQGFNTSGNAVNPQCWSQQIVSGSTSLNVQFVTTTAGTSPSVSSPFEGTRMAFFNSYSYSSSTRLVSGAISSTGVNSVDVNFQWYNYNSGPLSSYPTEGVTVQWSADGTTWNDFPGNLIYRYNTNSGWVPVTVTLPAGAGNLSTFYVGLKFTGNGGYDMYLDAMSVTATPTCFPPTALVASNITATTANLNFTASTTTPAGGYDYFVAGTNNTPPTATTVPTGNVSGTTIAISNLISASLNYVYVRSNCSGVDQSVWKSITITTLNVNDEASGALNLLVGAGCTTNPYNNTSATQSSNEPFPSCKGTAGYAGTWFKFIAPPSGMVKVSCDGSGTLGDSRMALFNATDVSNYSTFTILACDDDNGVTSSTRSLLYAAGLTSGLTYYVLVDLYNASAAKGTFCVTVDEFSSSMLATTAGNCIDDQASIGTFNTPGSTQAYTGWISLVDANGNLNANVRQLAGTETGFSSSRTIKTAAARTDVNGLPYLNRNFLIKGAGATSADVQLFFTDAELANLGAPLSSLNVSKVSGTTCNANFTGTATLLTQTANGSGNGINYIQVNTPGFSNFYIMSGNVPLPVAFEYIKGNTMQRENMIQWKINANAEKELTLTLEKSIDGKNFASILEQKVTADRCEKPFEYSDHELGSNVNYYRVKATNTDGKINISKVVTLVNKDQGFELVNIAPNPVKNRSILNFTSADKGNMTLMVTDIVGKLLFKQQTATVEGSNAIEMNFSSLKSGTYQLTIFNENGYSKTIRFVKN